MRAKKPISWTAGAVQYSIAIQLDFFRYTIVPNIYLNLEEMDLAVLSPSKLLWEVEIKVTMDDWRRDLEKTKWTNSLPHPCNPARFYYAVPEKLVAKGADGMYTIPEWVPPTAGILAVVNRRKQTTQPDGSLLVEDTPKCYPVRVAKALHRNKLPDQYVDEMYRKLSIRYWKSAYKNEPGNKIILPEN